VILARAGASSAFTSKVRPEPILASTLKYWRSSLRSCIDLVVAKASHGRPGASRCRRRSCSQNRTFERHELLVFGFANDSTVTDHPGMSDELLTIPSHAYAQFTLDAMSS
jgi:hypothetical protein